MSANIRLIRNKVHELASQVYILATGLQNAAPSGQGGKSIQYLLEAAADLEQTSKQIEELLPTDTHTESES